MKIIGQRKSVTLTYIFNNDERTMVVSMFVFRRWSDDK